MKAMNCLGLVLASGMLVACADRTPEGSAVDLAAEAQAIRERSAEWLKFAQAKDAAAIVNNI